MKKTLLATSLLIALSATTLSANAFCWRNLNPANWGTCPKCEKTASCKCKDKCKPTCEKKQKACPVEKKACPVEKKTCCPTEKKQTCCPTTPAPSCNTCPPATPCDPCDKLQQETER